MNRQIARCVAPIAALLAFALTAGNEATESRSPDRRGGLRARFVDEPNSVAYRAFDQLVQPVAVVEVDSDGLPPAAQRAFQRAIDIWARIIASPVSIRVAATMYPLPEEELGSAGPYNVFVNFQGAPADTWFPDVLADKLSGRDLSPTTPDIIAFFTNDPAVDWYFGTDGRPGSGQFDFVSVALHELAHALGFAGSAVVINGLGQWGENGFPDVFDRFVRNGSGQPIISFPSPSAGLAAELQSNNLFFVAPPSFTGISAATRLHAPSTFDEGSSYNHWDEDTFPAGHPDSLMTPVLSQMEAIHDPGILLRQALADMGHSLEGAAAVGPPAPTNLTATVAGNNVTIAFMPAPGATSYRLVATVGGATVFDANIGSATTVSATAPNGTYTVTVFAVNAAGQSSGVSTTFTVGGAVSPPTAPATVTAALGANRTVTVSWSAGSGATSYRLLAVLNGAVVFNQNVGPGTSVGPVRVPPGSYTVTIFSVNAAGESATGRSTPFNVP